MSTKKILSVSTALAVTVAFLDVPLAEAGRGHSTSVSVAHTHSIQTRVIHPRVIQPHRQARTTVKKFAKVVKKTPIRSKTLALGGNSHLKLANAHLSSLPIHNATAGSAFFKGRLNVPSNLKPKLTLTKLAKPQFQKKMGPFVQKYWKKSFFWVALAGIGYVTIPELYYDRFLGCIEVDDYDGCVGLLSMAALEEEEEAERLHYPMPSTARYRYSARVAPSQVANTSGDTSAVRQVNGAPCSFERFVERKWNTAFVWVRIPETGNVTVPEDYYDRFHGSVAASPPNYQAACAVLVEAAAADMMTMAGAGSDTQHQQLN